MSIEHVKYHISRLRHEHMRATGIEPKRLYLGRQESRAIENYIRSLPGVAFPLNYPETRRQFLGLEWFTVDADSHIDLT